MRPDSVCIARTNSPMFSSALASGLMTMLSPASTGFEVVVGDHDRDLDEFVDLEVESGHLAVDPDQSVTRGSHAASLAGRADTGASGGQSG